MAVCHCQSVCNDKAMNQMAGGDFDLLLVNGTRPVERTLDSHRFHCDAERKRARQRVRDSAPSSCRGVQPNMTSKYYRILHTGKQHREYNEHELIILAGF